MHWKVKAINGIGEWVKPDYQCFTVTDTSAYFVNSEMWAGYADDEQWIEAGDTVGHPWGSSVTHFWAEGNDGDYHEYKIPDAATNFPRNFTIDLDSDKKWRVRLDGIVSGVSTLPGNPATNADVGMESTDPNARAEAEIAALDYTDTNGGIHNGWNSSNYHPTSFTRGNFSVGWITKYTDLAVNAQTCTDAPAKLPRAAESQAAPVTPEGINRTVSGFLRGNGDLTPERVEAVKTSKSVVELNRNGGTQNKVPVTIVQAVGKFTGHQARLPAGKKIPRGRYLTVTLETATGNVLDWGISSRSINLPSLGMVQRIR
ncbi:hypothetical protein [Actinoallomurus vinaceus]